MRRQRPSRRSRKPRPREAIIALIDADANAVMWLTFEAVEAMRQLHGSGA